MTESHKIPKIAASAANLLKQQFQNNLNTLGTQTVEAMGFSEDDDWVVNFDDGTVSREVPDAPKDAP
ncbi:MAG TPA: hypothetical protein VN903_28710 [Polyangia bacterium]|nr:hypothetical protein [Polyangia bacterium]